MAGKNTVSATISTDAYVPSKTPQHASSPTREGASTSRSPACVQYLEEDEDCQVVSVTSPRRLCSSDIDTCLVQRTNTHFDDRSFAAAGPQVRNSLPTQLRKSDINLYSDTFDEHSKRIYLVTTAAAPTECCWCSVYELAYLLTYLLTYLSGNICSQFYRRYSRKVWLHCGFSVISAMTDRMV